ncbi:hypothetical protein RS030_2312 [Cryptosporidium xiaoi]|uniref:Uncharacterized protein n=1 Tax=Cryptosporidium xiaoi TaxID=659607 RepID=A0AAV9XW59_9CRYT
MDRSLNKLNGEIMKLIQGFANPNLRAFFNRNYLGIFNKYFVNLNKNEQINQKFKFELDEYKNMLSRQQCINNMYYTGKQSATR